MKKCNYCKKIKESSFFTKHSASKDRLSSHCKECHRIISHKSYLKRIKEIGIEKWREKSRISMRKWRKNNPEKVKQLNKYYRKLYGKKYNYSQAIYNLKKYEKIAGRVRPQKCEICGRNGRICYDHDHKTRKFRGWICMKCNCILGFANDDCKILKKIIIYLKNS